MVYVVDASVAVKWLVTEEDSARAFALLDSDADLIAPRFVIDEVANVLWKKCRRGLLSADDAVGRLQRLPGFFDRLLDDCDSSKVLELALQIDHPVYDCIYLQAALDLNVPLVTSDLRLAKQGDRPRMPLIYQLASMDLP